MLANARGAIKATGKTDSLRLEGRNTPPFSIPLPETRRFLASSTLPRKTNLRFRKPPPRSAQLSPSAHEQGAGQNAGQSLLPMAKTGYIQVTLLIYWKIYIFWFWKARHGQKIAARGFWRSLLGKSAGQNEIASPIY